MANHTAGNARSQFGFTILEALVSISVIAVLLSLLLPALTNVTLRADELALLANQQESIRLVFQYANDHNGRFPSFGIPETQVAPLTWNGQEIDFRWWDQSRYWGLYLHSEGYDGWITMGEEASPEAFDALDCYGCGEGFSRHYLTATAFAHANLFQDGASDDIRLHHPQRLAFASHPSDKIALTLWNVIRGQRTIIHCMDGSGEVARVDDLNPGVNFQFVGIIPVPGMVTKNGLQGRDR